MDAPRGVSSTPAAEPASVPDTTEAIPPAHEDTPIDGRPGGGEPGPAADVTEPRHPVRATEPIPEDVASALPQALRAIGSVVAPTSLLTALFIHFGMMDAIGYFRYFGINHTVLGIPFSEYLTLSSSDSAILPFIYLAGATALGLWIYHLPFTALPARAQRFTVLVVAPVAVAAGLALAGLALADVQLEGRVFPPTFLEGRGLSLAIGVLLVSFAGRLRRVLAEERRAGSRPAPGSVVRVSVIFLLVSVGLFLAVGNFAFGAGETRARGLAAMLTCRPDVVVFSEKSLNLSAPGVRESATTKAETAYRFRYDGLKLVPQSGSQYVLLPSGWAPADSVAIVLPRSSTLRLEFSRSPELHNPNCH